MQAKKTAAKSKGKKVGEKSWKDCCAKVHPIKDIVDLTPSE